MITIKSYSDLQQSKKLTEILPLESADMHYVNGKYAGCVPYLETTKGSKPWIKGVNISPCWSLAALLGVLPDELIDSDGDVYRIEFFHLKGKYIIQYPKLSTLWPLLFLVESHNPIDVCYEMILKLNELKML